MSHLLWKWMLLLKYRIFFNFALATLWMCGQSFFFRCGQNVVKPLNINCGQTKRAPSESLGKRLFTGGAVDGT